MQTGIDLHDLLRQEMLRFLPMDVIIRTVGRGSRYGCSHGKGHWVTLGSRSIPWIF